MGTVYKITNTENSLVYVGQTLDRLKYRLTRHKRDSKKYDNPISRAIKTIGGEAFSIEPLEENVPREKLLDREEFYIRKLDSIFPNGYNSCYRGTLANGRVLSQETRDKIGKGNSGKVRTEEVKKRIAETLTGQPNGWEGRKHSEESKRKISQARMGKKLKPFTEEHKRNMSEARKKLFRDSAARANEK